MIEATIETDRLILCGREFREAVPPAALHEVLGPPSRIDEPATPAPVGHRNNQVHVYDEAGIYFYEHHFTRLAESVAFCLAPSLESNWLTPAAGFTGRLSVDGFVVSPSAKERDFAECPVPFRYDFHAWQVKLGAISVFCPVRGARLPSGRRSKAWRVVGVHVGLPHDPWGGRKPPGLRER